MCSIALIEGDGDRDILAWGYAATWSPDGLRAYTDGVGVYVLDHTTGGVAALAAPSPAGLFTDGPTWSPDGARIAVTETAYDSAGASQWNLAVMNADGSNRIRLNGAVRITGGVAWAPTGTAIAFPGDGGGSEELYKVKLDGPSPARRTTKVGFAGAVTRTL